VAGEGMIRQIDNFYLDGNMGNATKITVAITCYNVGKYLARCIESVLAQTYKNLDIILVDDGSRDNSGLICDYYETQDNRIRVVHQNNTGPGEARNLAIDMAEGDYIAFVDGDDYVEPYMYEYLITALLRSGCALSICKYYSNGVDEEIDIHTFCGGIELFVPPHVNVVVKSRSFIGGVGNCATHTADPKAPTIHIVASNFLGGVDIKN
jgi:glycosyltransferase involved in cell wall biosynthesis